MTAPQDPSGRARRNGLGVAALVLGLLALPASATIVFGVLLGLLAVVLGVLGRGRVRRGEADDGGLALAGIVLGVLAVLASATLAAVGARVLDSDDGQRLQECLATAGEDQAAIGRCRSEFERRLQD